MTVCRPSDNRGRWKGSSTAAGCKGNLIKVKRISTKGKGLRNWGRQSQISRTAPLSSSFGSREREREGWWCLHRSGGAGGLCSWYLCVIPPLLSFFLLFLLSFQSSWPVWLVQPTTQHLRPIESGADELHTNPQSIHWATLSFFIHRQTHSKIFFGGGGGGGVLFSLFYAGFRSVVRAGPSISSCTAVAFLGAHAKTGQANR